MEATGESDCGPCLGEEIDLLTVEASFACASTSLKSCLKTSDGTSSSGFTGAVGAKGRVKKIRFPKAILLTTVYEFHHNAQEVAERSRRSFDPVIPHFSGAVGKQTIP